MDNWDELRFAKVDEWLSGCVEGKSFVDIGGLWQVRCERASLAYASGARSIAVMDISPLDAPEWEQLTEHLEGKGVPRGLCRHISADLGKCDATFEVATCCGVTYHLPFLLENLHKLNHSVSKNLIISGHALPTKIENAAGRLELPDGSAIFVPALSDNERAVLNEMWPGGGKYGLDSDAAFEFKLEGHPSPYHMYIGWWWLPTYSCWTRMLEVSGFEVLDRWTGNTYISALCRNKNHLESNQ